MTDKISNHQTTVTFSQRIKQDPEWLAPALMCLGGGALFAKRAWSGSAPLFNTTSAAALSAAGLGVLKWKYSPASKDTNPQNRPADPINKYDAPRSGAAASIGIQVDHTPDGSEDQALNPVMKVQTVNLGGATEKQRTAWAACWRKPDGSKVSSASGSWVTLQLPKVSVWSEVSDNGERELLRRDDLLPGWLAIAWIPAELIPGPREAKNAWVVWEADGQRHGCHVNIDGVNFER